MADRVRIEDINQGDNVNVAVTFGSPEFKPVAQVRHYQHHSRITFVDGTNRHLLPNSVVLRE